MFERCLYFNVNALARAVNRIWEEAFAEFDLSPSHAYLLRLVLAEPGLMPKQISEELKLEKSTITRFLHVLEERKLINRKRSSSGDAREQGIYPTRKAQNMAVRLEEKGNELYQKMTGDIGKARLIDLVGELRKAESQLKQN
jgi:DNA-binding MarR family transcriptional regulator